MGLFRRKPDPTEEDEAEPTLEEQEQNPELLAAEAEVNELPRMPDGLRIW